MNRPAYPTDPAWNSDQSTERYLETPAGRLFALERGLGDLVILLHGVTANAYVFEPLLEALSARHRVVAIDQRGHGRSATPTDGRYDDAAYAADVASIIDSLGGGPAVVVGHSLGGRNAVVAGATYPDRVSAVIAVDFTPFIAAQIFDSLDSRVAARWRSFDSLEEIRDYLAHSYVRLPSEAIERRLLHGYARGGDGAFHPLARPGAMTATCSGLRSDLGPYLVSLAVPALLVRGAQSAFVTPEAFEATRSLRPDLSASVVEGADHYIPEEQPDVLAELIESFLAGNGPAWPPVSATPRRTDG